ncbi:ScbR family autoregulator-binding transcription factor [Streptomyces sp. AC555_RSS877]|uniref:ScbR family autoregulator-binding transcription factor n=1 Tax=Streptomyces sp. AC555_RSS877 TaxID=2823688 RepID=UPI001C279E14|nr:ScbR family autoregulator-binding transcription factor [Streptomyces sp. AC555_RSS877]
MAKQERSERTLEKLTVSAAEQFALHGFVKATLGDVSRAAGVTKGALFFHFATKDDLAAAVQRRGQDILEMVIADLSCAEESCLQVVVNAMHSLSRLLRSDPFIRAGVRIARERTAGGSAPMDFYPLWLGQLGQVLEEARKKGELAADVADVSARTLVTAVVCGVETLAWMGVSQDESDKWLESLWELVLPAIASADGLRRVRATAPAAMP